MVKEEIVKELAGRNQMTLIDTEHFLNSFTDLLKEVLVSGDEFYYAGIGTFTTRTELLHSRKKPGKVLEIKHPNYESDVNVPDVKYREVFGMVNALN